MSVSEAPRGIEKLLIRLRGRAFRGLNGLFFRHVGGANRPVFFDVEATYPALRRIDENYDVIRAELMPLLPQLDRIPRYHDVDEVQRPISEGPRNWRTLFAYVYRANDVIDQQGLCPRTSQILREIPGVILGFFSILDAGKSVPAHNGGYLGHLRYHTAFVVPKNSPPKIRIKDKVYEWKERESVLFDDSWNHEVYNESDGVRVVLIVDVLRPMSRLHRIVNRVGVRFIFCRYFIKKMLSRIGSAP
jgi:aspartate beta-hydroxylase/beta-hydroxylase